MDFLKMRNSIKIKSPKDKILHSANLIMDKTFNRDLGYQKTAIYDRMGNFIKEIEFKFQRVKEYTINKDQVEYVIQFRPNFHPEIELNKEGEKDFLGFYVDVIDDANETCKYLIVGRDDRLSFIRYNVLKCNWTFKWVKEGKILSQLGVLRSRNNYNSGVWREYFTTTVQNQIQFIVPSNINSYTIDYDDRFMLTTNKTHPKVYITTKVEDTFPTGVIKVTLAQDHYNSKTDILDEMVCNYFSVDENLSLVSKKGVEEEIDDIRIKKLVDLYLDFLGRSAWENKTIRVGGQTRRLSVSSLYEALNSKIELKSENPFSFRFDSREVSISELENYFKIEEDYSTFNKTLKIKAISKEAIGKVLEVILSSNIEVKYPIESNKYEKKELSIYKVFATLEVH